MATKKEGGKNRKIGRHSRGGSNANQAKRTERNKAQRDQNIVHVPAKAPRPPGVSYLDGEQGLRDWHAEHRAAKIYFERRAIRAKVQALVAEHKEAQKNGSYRLPETLKASLARLDAEKAAKSAVALRDFKLARKAAAKQAQRRTVRV